MAGVLQHLRSSTLNKRPNPASMVDGQLAINYASGSPGAFFKDSNGNLVKVGPVHVGATAPNVSPASGGTAGNSLGEQWLDTSGGTYVFKIWDGAAWRSEAGEFVNTTGDTMTGALGIIAGSASTPGLFFSGDANSGLYSPGADQVAISTNGSGRLFVDASGRVGVGTSSPSYTLQVAETSAVVSAASYSTFFGQGTRADLVLQATSSNNDQQRQVIRSNSDSLIFGTENAAVTTFTEKLRIDSSGRVGIGTSSPSYLLHVSGNGAEIGLTDTAVTNATWRLLASTGGSTKLFRIYDSSNAADRLVIDSSGRVGIGDTGPDSTLTIKAAASTTPLRVSGPSSEFMRCDQSGRLLVGTSSSASTGDAQYARLQVQGNTAASTNGAILALMRQQAATAPLSAGDLLGKIDFTDSSGNTFGTIFCGADASTGSNDYPGRLVFSTTADGASSPTERMRIGQSGIVDIGSGGVGGNFRAMVASGSAMQFSNTNTATTNLTFIEFGRSATSPGNYTAEGTIGTDGSGNLAFTNASDVNLKENIRDLNACLETVKSLRPVLFDWKTDYKPCCTDVKGFIAQEFEQVLPKSVSTDEAGIKSVSPVSELLPILVGAIKELTVQVAELEAKVAALESA